jgi:hypothetical protein
MTTRSLRFQPQVEALEDRLALSGPHARIVPVFLPNIGTVFETPFTLSRQRHALTLQHPQTLGPLLLSVPDFHDPSAHQNPNTFVGRVAGTNAFVAVVVDNGEALAYVCDDHSISTWLRGPINGNGLTLAGDKGTALAGTLEGDTLSGTLTLSGQTFAFQASRVVEGRSGLFRGTLPVDGKPGTLGLIKIESEARGVMQRVPRIGHIYC